MSQALLYWAEITPDQPAWWLNDREVAGPASETGRSLSIQKFWTDSIGYSSRAFLTWSELSQLIKRLSYGLSATVSRNTWTDSYPPRVVSCLPNGLWWVSLDLACQMAGLVHAPLDLRLPRTPIDECIHRLRPSIVIEEISQLQPFLGKEKLETPAFVNSEQLATILFTSGTSGFRQGVMLSHRNLVHNAWAKMEMVPQYSSDRRVNLLSFSHAYARTCELSTWLLSGSSLGCVADLDELYANASTWQPTLFNGVPYLFEKIANRIEKYVEAGVSIEESASSLFGTSMRCLASGGAGLPKHIFDFFARLRLPIVQGYGMTEASPVVCSNSSASPLPDCVGRVVRDTEIRIDDQQRLFVRGPGVMLGYWDDVAATQAKLSEGWLDTGDRANLLPDDQVKILGRCDDVLVLSTGNKIDPLVIVQRICEISSIQHALLVGDGQASVIAIVVSSNTSESSLLQWIVEKLEDQPKYCIPKRLLIVQDDWTIESGLINHKGAVVRAAVIEKYREEIQQLYLELNPKGIE